ncbi:WD40 repeat-like protein [Suillus hirtellus]|nr:WD40 repeat-like protein [Suillus hirtellus]
MHQTRERKMIYSPDATKIATGGDGEDAVKIWDAETGELLNTLKHKNQAWSLAWTSNGKKLISGLYGLIGIFDTATWQEIAFLEGHINHVNALSLSQNDCLLASGSWDKRAYLWNLDTNLPIGPFLQHEHGLQCAAFSADGKLLVTGCANKNAYIWNIHTILKEAGLKGLLLPLSHVAARESLIDAGATQAVDDELWPGFFNDATDSANPSGTYGNYHPSSSRRPRPLAPSFGSVNTLFGRLWSPFRRSHSKTNESTELQQRPRRALLFRGSRIVEVAAVKDREVIFTAPPPPEKTQQQTRSHAQESFMTQPASGTNPTTPRPRYPHSLPVRLLAHLVLFLCCASPQHANGNTQPTQQQGHPQGQVYDHAQASSLETQSTAASTSAPATIPTALSAASA